MAYCYRLNNAQKKIARNLEGKKTKINSNGLSKKLLESCFTTQEIDVVKKHLEANAQTYFGMRNQNTRYSAQTCIEIDIPCSNKAYWGYLYPVNKPQLRKNDAVMKEFEKEVKKRLEEKYACEDATVTVLVKVQETWSPHTRMYNNEVSQVCLALEGSTRIILDEYIAQKNEARGWLRNLRAERATIQADIDLLEKVITDE